MKTFLAALALSTVMASSAMASNILPADGIPGSTEFSSVLTGAFNINVGVAETNLLTGSTNPTLSNGDTRFIFANSDPIQSITVKLNGLETLIGFGATFSSTDRVPSTFEVETSTNGTTFNVFGGPISTSGGGGPDLITGAPVSALYIEYLFGPAGGANGTPNGAGVSQLFASAVPEASTWAMMILGFVGIGFMSYRRRRSAGALGIV